ncbi:hypothetical protein EUTSA_v10009792mg, partial [Eutrema salsugineum]
IFRLDFSNLHRIMECFPNLETQNNSYEALLGMVYPVLSGTTAGLVANHLSISLVSRDRDLWRFLLRARCPMHVSTTFGKLQSLEHDSLFSEKCVYCYCQRLFRIDQREQIFTIGNAAMQMEDPSLPLPLGLQLGLMCLFEETRDHLLSAAYLNRTAWASIIPRGLRTMEKKKSEVSSTEAVLLGALAPGVNVLGSEFSLQAPTWNTLKFAFLLLGLCLTFMLSIAFTSGQSMLLVHVGFLIIIASTLFFLLNWFLAQTGLVPVETQMQDLNLSPTDKSK